MAPKVFADIKKRKKPATEIVPICMEPDLAFKYSKIKNRIEALNDISKVRELDEDQKSELSDLKIDLDELEPEVVEATVDFVIRAKSRLLMDELMNSHPPTAQQKKEATKAGHGELNWNPDTFPPALVAASLVDPVMTEEEAQELWSSDDWNQAELNALFEAAVVVNGSRVSLDLKKE